MMDSGWENSFADYSAGSRRKWANFSEKKGEFLMRLEKLTPTFQ
jgi:hypothetical protein